MLKDSLGSAAYELIQKYGSEVTLTKTIASSTYDPQTGTYAKTTTTFIDKGVFNKSTNKELKQGGFPENMWSSVSGSITMKYKPEYLAIDNTWTVNDRKVLKAVKDMLQDDHITLRIYF